MTNEDQDKKLKEEIEKIKNETVGYVVEDLDPEGYDLIDPSLAKKLATQAVDLYVDDLEKGVDLADVDLVGLSPKSVKDDMKKLLIEEKIKSLKNTLTQNQIIAKVPEIKKEIEHNFPDLTYDKIKELKQNLTKTKWGLPSERMLDQLYSEYGISNIQNTVGDNTIYANFMKSKLYKDGPSVQEAFEYVFEDTSGKELRNARFWNSAFVLAQKVGKLNVLQENILKNLRTKYITKKKALETQ